MNKILNRILLGLATVLVASSCMINSIDGNGNIVSRDFTTEPYEEVEVQGGMDITLVQGAEGNITVEGDENLMDYLDIDTRDGRLVLDFDHNGGFNSAHGILITVPIEDIDAAIVSGSGMIKSDLTINSNEFNSIVSGSGDILLSVNSAKHRAVISGSGDIRLRGQTENLSATVSGSGKIDASDLPANDAQATISGSGDILLHMNGGQLDAKISGSGDITYKGEIGNQKSSIVGSGNLRRNS